VDHWNTLPTVGWIFVIFALGYVAGLIHGFFKHWLSGKAYCPRCLYYFNWRDTLLREVFPDWAARPRNPDPWERQNPSTPQHSSAND